VAECPSCNDVNRIQLKVDSTPRKFITSNANAQLLPEEYNRRKLANVIILAQISAYQKRNKKMKIDA